MLSDDFGPYPDEETTDHEPFPDEGFTTFETSHTVGDKVDQKLLSVTVRATYSFGRTVDMESMQAPLASAQQFVEARAVAKMDEVMERERAQQRAAPNPYVGNVTSTQPAPPVHPVPAAPAAAPPDFSPGGAAVHLRVGRGKGQNKDLYFLPTTVMPTEALKQRVANVIREHGLDANHFVVFDNRPGDKGLEAGQPNYSVARVVAGQDGPFAQQLGNKTAFFIDFTREGALKVTPSNEMQTMLTFYNAHRASTAGLVQQP